MASRTIPNDLLEFKNALEGKVDKVVSDAGDIAKSIGDVATISNTAKASVAEAYKPADGNNQAVAKLESLSTLVEAISSDVTSTASAAASSANAIISDVNEMDSLIKDMEAQEGIVSKERAKKDPDKPNTSKISAAQSKIKEDESKFDELEAKAKSALEALKGMDKSVQEVGSVGAAGDAKEVSKDDVTGGATTQLAEYTKYLNQLKYGTFTKKRYADPNGVAIDYFVYVPDYGQKVSGLPTLMFMHGGGDKGIGDHVCTDSCVGELIKNKSITPSGIVILPHVPVCTANYENPKYRKALANLAVSVSKEYDGDPNRISVGGLSYGGVIAHKLITENPGTFSAVVSACGANDVDSSYQGVSVWNFNGMASATNHTDKKYVAKQTEAVKAAGGDTMPYIQFKGQYAHTNVGNLTFQQKQQDQDGNMVWVIEWAFSQVKGKPIQSTVYKG